MDSMKVCFLVLVGAAICHAASHRIHVSRKHPTLHDIRRMLERAKGVEPVVSRDGDIFYSGNITVGTPPQTFVTDFDTGSSDLWILDGSCKEDDCKDTPLFQKNQSSTFKSDGVPEILSYGDGTTVYGNRAFETLTVGELSVKSQPFVLVTQSYGIRDVKSIFGLGNRGKSGTPPFYTAVAQKAVDKPILTVFLEKSEDNTFGGDITFGDYDTKNCGPVYAKTNSTDKGDWFVSTNGISINDKKVFTKSIAGVIDTGSTAVMLPFDITEIIDDIQKTVKLERTSGEYLLACDDAKKLPSLTVNINGYDHVINGTQLAIPLEGEKDRCLFLLIGEPRVPLLILGDVFIRDRCVSQNVETKEVSFAHRK